MIDLDANATAPLRPAVGEAMHAAYDMAGGNPSSAHALGRKARQFLENARDTVARHLDCRADEVVFTSGATEANNLAVFGLAGDGGHLVTTPIEHPCVVAPVSQLESRGLTVSRVPVDGQGFVTAADVLAAVRPGTSLVSVMLANHETGAVQPVGEVAASLPKGVAIHTDAAPAVGKIPVSFRSLGVTTLTASGHKFGGPSGVGVLIVKSGTDLKPRTFGGHQQKGLRPGTEPVALAVGFAAALDDAVASMAGERLRVNTLRIRLWDALRAGTNAVLNGPAIDDPRSLPNTLNVSFPGRRADLLLMALDLAGVACSAGSACSSGSLLPSPVLAAMGVPDDRLRSALRFSLSWKTTASEIDAAGERIVRVAKSTRP
jgi:cysteine desulfurase